MCGDGGCKSENVFNTMESCVFNVYSAGPVTSTLPMIETSAPFEDPGKRSYMT